LPSASDAQKFGADEMAAQKTVYVDGHAGTTGLRIREWLTGRPELELLTLSEAERKDDAARRAAIARADLAVLCLPDDAARAAASWAEQAGARVLDASTAHRVAKGWVYGLPELDPESRSRIRAAARVSNPGCHASSVILLLRPLIDAAILDRRAALSLHSLSGYTGGGRAKIERWESPDFGLVGLPFEAPYALEHVHKHIPEMMEYARLEREPYFAPAVGPFPTGMRVQIPLHASLLDGSGPERIWSALSERYRDEPFVELRPLGEPIDDKTLDPRLCDQTNRIQLRVVAHPSGHVLLVAISDNLGKGASGVAIQNLNLMLGFEETAGLPR
jgi:N-acetyl-gamma-glutamyl-phosphate reductase